MKKIKELITNELFKIELVFFIGFLIITVTNFLINMYFGLYFIGISLIALSIFQFTFRKR